MALRLISRSSAAFTAPAGARGRWLSNNVYTYHRLTGLYLMTVEMTGTNPPTLNIRGGAHNQDSQFGTYWRSSTTAHIHLDSESQIVLIGTGEGDGKTTVSFIKIGDQL
ncbi:hypothetical protein [Corynebacterium sp. HMSC072A04]|uniref:hypothetical protein n=1 Tax=Corynebacterium sp. HMSC072A04 TaxID=1715045 RepID=UPI0008CE6BCD|nr:hypothetical protein [Corynebacterium sp. HMSC072A04]OFN33603.1 hypothetical protein HMPREF2565_11740 [Corynebacterium sp. HMSC072A04]